MVSFLIFRIQQVSLSSAGEISRWSNQAQLPAAPRTHQPLAFRRAWLLTRHNQTNTHPFRQPRRECSCIIRLKSAPHEKVYTMSKEVGYRKKENPPRPPNPNHKISTRKTGAARGGGRREQGCRGDSRRFPRVPPTSYSILAAQEPSKSNQSSRGRCARSLI